jgi:transposase InsO family protein
MEDGKTPTPGTWACFRFSVVGRLLASPPKRGELKCALEDLASTVWNHPVTGEPTTFAMKTIEDWFYRAKNEDNDPVGALRRSSRKDTGFSTALDKKLQEKLVDLYHDHPTWTYQLHRDNLKVVAEDETPPLSPPSYSTVRRFLVASGLRPVKRKKVMETKRGAAIRKSREGREIRGYEAEYVGSLWHLDFHEANDLQVILPSGERVKPKLLGILDDKSRLGCHLQWYLQETAEELAHGLSQAFQKRGIPWEILFDNGSAMIARETTEGLMRIGITPNTTLVASPYQNGKQERFFGTVEGRLMKMLEGVERLTLEFLNEATQAWVEMEYNHEKHSEIGQPPLHSFLNEPNRLRESPRSGTIRNAFRIKVTRTQRKGDGTLTLDGVRFEVPSRYRHFRKLTILYARWDLTNVHLVDPKTEVLLTAIYPVNKVKNAEGLRRVIDDAPSLETEVKPSGGLAPLLRKLMADYSATGVPPAYIPKSRTDEA